MNILQQILFALVSGYVLGEMFKLPYSQCLYVAFVSAAVPLVLIGYKRKKKGATNLGKTK